MSLEESEVAARASFQTCEEDAVQQRSMHRQEMTTLQEKTRTVVTRIREQAETKLQEHLQEQRQQHETVAGCAAEMQGEANAAAARVAELEGKLVLEQEAARGSAIHVDELRVELDRQQNGVAEEGVSKALEERIAQLEASLEQQGEVAEEHKNADQEAQVVASRLAELEQEFEEVVSASLADEAKNKSAMANSDAHSAAAAVRIEELLGEVQAGTTRSGELEAELVLQKQTQVHISELEARLEAKVSMVGRRSRKLLP